MQLTLDNIIKLMNNYNNKFIIYRIYNKDSNKSYIGKSQKGLNRVLDHYKQCLNPSQEYRAKLLYRAIRKHGRDNFNFEVLFVSFDILHLDEMEKYFIKCYNTTNPSVGYNITDGGTGGHTTKNFTEEQMVIYKRNLKNSKKPQSVESKLKQSELMKQMRSNPEKCKKNSEVCRERMLKLNNNPEFKRKIKESRNIKIYCKELNITFESMTECSKYFKVTSAAIWSYFKRKKIAKKYKNCYTLIKIEKETCK